MCFRVAHLLEGTEALGAGVIPWSATCSLTVVGFCFLF